MRTQYDYDKDTTSGTIDKQTNRFYMDLRGDFKVNDYWTVKFQSETNRHYNDGHRRANEGGINNYGKDNYTGQKTWSGHDGNMQRIWVEGKKDGLGWINIGRAWRGLGFQNVLVGNETDGLQFGVPIKGTNLTASGFWFASTGDGNKESLYGAAIWGPVAKNLISILPMQRAVWTKEKLIIRAILTITMLIPMINIKSSPNMVTAKRI